MPNTPTKVAQGQLSNVDSAVYTPSSGVLYSTITAIYFANTNTSDHTFRLHYVDSGGSTAANNALYYDQGLAAKRTFKDGPGIVVKAGDSLRGLASTASVLTYTIFAIETR